LVSATPPASLSASTWWYSCVTALRSTGRNASDGVPAARSMAAVRTFERIGAAHWAMLAQAAIQRCDGKGH
jgi:hypothetical protein